MQIPREWPTARLLIRRFRESDLEGFHELHGDPEAMHFLGGVWTIERSRTTLAGIVAKYSESDLEWMAVTRKADGGVIGVCWLGHWGPFWRPVLPEGDVELGYRYARRFWGNGYATEAARAMLHRGFFELDLPRIVAIVDVNNLASQRVLQKIGMTPGREYSNVRKDTNQQILARYYQISRP